jgi:hypothetical protein
LVVYEWQRRDSFVIFVKDSSAANGSLRSTPDRHIRSSCSDLSSVTAAQLHTPADRVCGNTKRNVLSVMILLIRLFQERNPKPMTLHQWTK